MNLPLPDACGLHRIGHYFLQSSDDKSTSPREDSWITHNPPITTESEAKTGLERAISISLGQYHVRLIHVTGALTVSVLDSSRKPSE